MKKLLLFGALAAVVSCKPASFTVSGSAENTDADGQTVYLSESYTGKVLDSATVVQGKYTFTHKVPDTLVLYKVGLGRAQALFIPEAGDITLEIPVRGTSFAVGTPLNDTLKGYIDDMSRQDAIVEELYNKRNAAAKGSPERETLDKEFEQGYQSYQAETKRLGKSVFDNNKDNVVGLYLLPSLVADQKSVAAIDSLIATLTAPKSVEFERVGKIRDRKVAEENTGVGKHYLDIDGVDLKGNPVKLSDYVGKGKWVVVDFWASWCGPCRAAMPHLKEIYKAYKRKGLNVVGVNVWERRHEDFEKGVKELDLPWPMIHTMERKATDTYGVAGIPTILLINPDGQIVVRTHNGDEVVSKVKEVL